MIDWSKISDTCKYVIDDDNAKMVYDVLQMSYVGRNKTLPTSLSQGTYNYYNYKLEYKYEDGVLYIEESVSGGPGGIIDELLLFLVPLDSIYIITERCKDGVPLSYSVKDDEGKYFVRPPKTEHELQQEAEARKLEEDAIDDLPF